MDWRNRVGLYGSYFFGAAGIGFTLPYLPLYLGQQGLSDRSIGLISTLAALAGLAQFPVGLWSDRIGRRKPFLVVALGMLAVSTALLREVHSVFWLGVLVVLFPENGVCRAVVESLSGAEAAWLARPGEVGAALGALRFWKPIGIVAMAIVGSLFAERYGIGSILTPLTVVQGLGCAALLTIHEDGPVRHVVPRTRGKLVGGRLPRDPALWSFIAAMVLFHAANAPGGVYLGLFLSRDLHAPERLLAYAFIVSMATWTLVVWPAGWLADRWGRRPLLIAAWGIMTLRLALVSVARSPEHLILIQVLDGVANAMFAVLAAAWVTDRLADPRRSGEAQVIVGSCLVLGSAIGPAAASFLVGPLGYRGLFAALAGVGAVAASCIVCLVPETLACRGGQLDGRIAPQLGPAPDLSAAP
jgi:MFS family permease